MTPGARLLAPLAVLVSAAVLLAGCSGGGSADGPTWVPQPPYTLEPNPINPGSGPTAAPNPADPSNPSAAPAPSPSTTSPPIDPLVVAAGLDAPIGIAVMPDGTALVGQRKTGAIVLVQPTTGQPVAAVRTIPGLDATGDGGLLDLAISPSYDEDHLIYAYLTTATDNRVVDFTLSGPITAVFTGIPKSATGNGGRIAFGADGNLYIGTGYAGQPSFAQDPKSLAGKVLEVTDIGAPVNPAGPVLTRGHHNLAGLCVDPATAAIFETEAGDQGGVAPNADEINLLASGRDYGWPTAGPTTTKALATLPAAADGTRAVAGGCAVADGVLYVAALAGTALYSTDVVQSAQDHSIKLADFGAPTLTGKYGRLITVVADPTDGSLWLATSNKNAGYTPTGAADTDERILHIQPAGGGGSSQV